MPDGYFTVKKIDGKLEFKVHNTVYETINESVMNLIRWTDEKYNLLSENLEVTITFMDDKPISINLPKNIECTVEETDAVVKGQTAASSYKPAKLKNGVSITVPPFVESGDKIILDTRNLEYVKKVN